MVTTDRDNKFPDLFGDRVLFYCFVVLHYEDDFLFDNAFGSFWVFSRSTVCSSLFSFEMFVKAEKNRGPYDLWALSCGFSFCFILYLWMICLL